LKKLTELERAGGGGDEMMSRYENIRVTIKRKPIKNGNKQDFITLHKAKSTLRFAVDPEAV
jgi:hypothetical protein